MSEFIPQVQTLGSLSTIANTASALGNALGFGGGNTLGTQTAWMQALRPASFRGVPFGVLTTEGRFGRRQAVHEYPFRDIPYVEDIGKSTRRISFAGFLITNSLAYGGGDVLIQREQMIAAAETAGPGTLVHPTLGRLQVSLIDFVVTEKWDNGRYFEIGFAFVEAGQRIFPSLDIATGDAVDAAADAANSAASADFATRALIDLTQGAAIVKQALGTSQIWSLKAQALANDATNLYDAIGAALPGNFGRFFGGRNVGGMTGSKPAIAIASATVASLVSQGTTARASVAAAALSLNTVTGNLGTGGNSPIDVAKAVQGLSAALRTATADPADAIRLLSSLATFTPSAPTPQSQIGLSMADMQSACGDLFRRAAVTAMAQAATIYQPSSQDDAATTRGTVTGYLDSEISIAGDQGEDATYNALRALRVSVVQDLTTRGATLAPIATFKFNAALPALALATRIYRDPSRADQLVTQVNPMHPLFMPTVFKALAN